MKIVYLDNAATMPCFEVVANTAKRILTEQYFNPSSEYASKTQILQEISSSRQALAQILSVKESEIFFSSGATEANNLAIFSGFKNKKGTLITTMGEHPSVYNSVMQLKNRGFSVDFVGLNRDGTVDLNQLLAKIDQNTAVVSIFHVNNESGAVNDIDDIFTKIKHINPAIVTHSDGVQAFCKQKVDLNSVDLYTISAHKIGGLKGVGAIRIKSGLKLQPLIFGGGQEQGLRAGTENTAAIATFGLAAQQFLSVYDRQKISDLQEVFVKTLQGNDRFVPLSDPNASVPNIIAFSILGVRAQTMQSMLGDCGIFVGIGSACSSKNRDNRVLKAMGIKQNTIDGALRVSLSPLNTVDEVKFAAQKIGEIANSL